MNTFLRRLWLNHIRPIVYPWYFERDHDASFRRWLRETEHGQQGYQDLRAAIMQCIPDVADEWPERLEYDDD